MSFLQSLFGGANNQQAPQQVQTQPGNLQDPATVAAQSQAPTPNNPPAPGSAAINTTNPDSSIAQFEKLWETNQAGTDNQPPANPASLNLTPEAISKIVANTNFAQNLDPQTLAAISAGGEQAQVALAQAMNQVAQQVFTQATMVNSKLAEKQIQAAIAAEVSKLPNTLKSQAVADHMTSTNALFNNPAIKPVADSAREQLIRQYPNASQADITKMVQDYMVAMGTAFAPPKPDTSPAAKEQDWTTYLD